eukprot:12867321-Alexandrium_andersonii.AAC.1
MGWPVGPGPLPSRPLRPLSRTCLRERSPVPSQALFARGPRPWHARWHGQSLALATGATAAR